MQGLLGSVWEVGSSTRCEEIKEPSLDRTVVLRPMFESRCLGSKVCITQTISSLFVKVALLLLGKMYLK